MATTIKILDLQSNAILTLPYVPETLQIQNQANFSAVNIRGINNVPQQFTSSSRTLSFSVDYPSVKTRNDEFYEDALNAHRFFEALTKNNPTEGYSLVRIQWASMFDDSTWILQNANSTLRNFKQVMGYSPSQINIEVSFIEQPRILKDKGAYQDDYKNVILRAVSAAQIFRLGGGL